jgi:hypothetical protein
MICQFISVYYFFGRTRLSCLVENHLQHFLYAASQLLLIPVYIMSDTTDISKIYDALALEDAEQNALPERGNQTEVRFV